MRDAESPAPIPRGSRPARPPSWARRRARWPRARRSLASLWPAAALRGVLAARDDWRPIPAIGAARRVDGARAAPARAARAARRAGAGRPIAALPATLFLDYARTGNRQRFEQAMFDRRDRLHALVLAECVEDRGRFLDAIVDTAWADRRGVVVDRPRAPGRAEGAAAASPTRPSPSSISSRRRPRTRSRGRSTCSATGWTRCRRSCAPQARAGDRSARARARISRATTSGGWGSRRDRPAEQLEPVDQLERDGRRRCSSSPTPIGGPGLRSQGAAKPGQVPRSVPADGSCDEGPALLVARRREPVRVPRALCARRRAAASTCSRTRSWPTSAGSSTGRASRGGGSSTSATAGARQHRPGARRFAPRRAGRTTGTRGSTRT